MRSAGAISGFRANPALTPEMYPKTHAIRTLCITGWVVNSPQVVFPSLRISTVGNPHSADTGITEETKVAAIMKRLLNRMGPPELQACNTPMLREASKDSSLRMAIAYWKLLPSAHHLWLTPSTR
jgi:hypothetical protein